MVICRSGDAQTYVPDHERPVVRSTPNPAPMIRIEREPEYITSAREELAARLLARIRGVPYNASK